MERFHSTTLSKTKQLLTTSGAQKPSKPKNNRVNIAAKVGWKVEV